MKIIFGKSIDRNRKQTSTCLRPREFGDNDFLASIARRTCNPIEMAPMKPLRGLLVRPNYAYAVHVIFDQLRHLLLAQLFGSSRIEELCVP
jgi:hypothetical protein